MTVSRAAIIAVGSELLTPLRIDTNSLFITEQLNLLGVSVTMIDSVGSTRRSSTGTTSMLAEEAPAGMTT